MERAKPLPGFRDHSEGIAVDAYGIDVDHWTEGFFTFVHPPEIE